MATEYTDVDKIAELSGDLLSTNVPSITPSYVSAQIDAILTTQFELLDQIYYLQVGGSTTNIVLKTPLYPVDVSNSAYSSDINSTSLDNIIEIDSKKTSPIIYVKEHDSKYPPLVDETPLIQGIR